MVNLEGHKRGEAINSAPEFTLRNWENQSASFQLILHNGYFWNEMAICWSRNLEYV